MIQELNSKKIYGYATSRPFGPFIMPVPAQNSCMREYASRNQYQYIPPQLEHKFFNCYMQLFGTIRRTPISGDIVMYSAEILMDASSDKLLKLANKIFEKEITLHFVLENIAVNTLEDLRKLQHRYKVKKMIG